MVGALQNRGTELDEKAREIDALKKLLGESADKVKEVDALKKLLQESDKKQEELQSKVSSLEFGIFKSQEKLANLQRSKDHQAIGLQHLLEVSENKLAEETRRTGQLKAEVGWKL
jgi:chromosome segregation ATPase